MQFPDYPKLGVWPDAYYIAFNIFNNGTTFAGPKVCAYDRAAMLSGATARQQCFQLGTNVASLLPSDLDRGGRAAGGSAKRFPEPGLEPDEPEEPPAAAGVRSPLKPSPPTLSSGAAAIPPRQQDVPEWPSERGVGDAGL